MTEQEYFVQRLVPRERKQVFVATPPALAVSVAFLLMMMAAFSAGAFAAALILGALGALAGVAAWSTRAVPHPHPRLPSGPAGWRIITQLMRLDPDAVLRDYVYVGTVFGSNGSVPALIHKQLIRHHVHVLGATGRGKSAGIVVPVCAQLLRMRDCSLLYIDLKGDTATYLTLAAQAQAAGMRVLVFSLNANEASGLLNIFTDPAFQRLTTSEQAQLLVQALGIPMAETYGAGFFGSAVRSSFRRLLRHFRDTGMTPSFAALYDFLLRSTAKKLLAMSKKDFESASHGVLLLENCIEHARLNMIGTERIEASLFANAITVDKLFQERTLIYLKLPALSELSVARMIARLVARLVEVTAQQWTGPRVPHLYVCYDEVQEALQMSMSTGLKQIRAYDVSYIFVHQTMMDLQQADIDFLEAMNGNTAVKFIMSAGDDYTRDFLTSRSPEKVRLLKTSSTSTADGPTGTTYSSAEQLAETIIPAIGPTELALLNSREDLACVLASPDKDLTRFTTPTFVETTFSIDRSTYETYKVQGWPAADGVTTVLASDLPAPDAVTAAPTSLAPVAQTPARPATPTTPVAHQRRKRTPKPVDPDEQRLAAEAAAKLRSLKSKLGKKADGK